MSTRTEYDDFLRGWKARGMPVTDIQCPHCRRAHGIPRIPDTDSLAICPECDELFMKVIDGQGRAHAIAIEVGA